MKIVKGCFGKVVSSLIVLGLFAAGCGSGGDGTGGAPASAQPGTLGVSLTDAPACGYDAVNVTVSKVRVHRSSSADEKSSGWSDITLDPPKRINLLDYNDPTQLNGALLPLGETSLGAGHYTQVRLVLVPNSGSSPLANSIILSGSATEIALDTPSAVQSGIKLIHEFDVPSGQRVDLVLDFDACKSIVLTGSGKYKLMPVIKVIPFVLNGIDGFVDTALLGDHVVVTAQKNGEIIRSTVLNSVSGKFFLARLDAPDNYDVVVTADGHATAVISDVPVSTATSITHISTDLAPIILLTSATQRTVAGTVTLNPAVDEEAVHLAAKQSLTSGPTVTVKTAMAAGIAGAPIGDYSYSLTLPTAPPTLGAFTGALPITLTQQGAGVGGKYAVAASAAGYATQSSNVDISAANATQDFTLVP